MNATAVASRRLRVEKLQHHLAGAAEIRTAAELMVRGAVDRRTAAQATHTHALGYGTWQEREQTRDALAFAEAAAEVAIIARDAVLADIARREKLLAAAEARYAEVRIFDRSLNAEPATIADGWLAPAR